MHNFTINSDKSIAQVRQGIDRTILLYSWKQTSMCPLCECEAPITFDERADGDRYVAVEDCVSCDHVLQNVAGDFEK